MDHLKNNKGFLFLSLALSLVALVIAIPLAIYVLKISTTKDIYDQHSVNTFFQLIHNELLYSVNYTIKDDSIELLSYNDEKILISKYKNLIRRQVNGKGHEVFLRDVNSFQVEKNQTGFIISIETMTGDIFEKRFSFYHF